jgi:hypothetical protein
MKSYEFEAAIYDNEVYCCRCLPVGVGINDDGVMHIFGDSEWVSAPVCCKCGKEHLYVNLLDEVQNGGYEDEAE